MNTCKLTLTLEIEYVLNETSKEWLKTQLRAMVMEASGNGLFTGDSDAEVEEWVVGVKETT